MKALACFAGFALCAGTAHAAVVMDIASYWMPGGATIHNPTIPPLGALALVHQTVFDDAEGRAVLGQAIADGAVTGGPLPADPPVRVIRYVITNLTYANGASGQSAGIAAFDVTRLISQVYSVYAPSAAAGRWSALDFVVPPGPGAPFPVSSWFVDANANTLAGDGIGLLLGQSSPHFYLVTNPYDLITMLPASISGWSGAGALEEPASVRIDTITGEALTVAPAPAALATFALAPLAALRRRR